MKRTCIEGRGGSKKVCLDGERYRSPRGTRVKAGAVNVRLTGRRGGSVTVSQGRVTERWHRLCA